MKTIILLLVFLYSAFNLYAQRSNMFIKLSYSNSFHANPAHVVRIELKKGSDSDYNVYVNHRVLKHRKYRGLHEKQLDTMYSVSRIVFDRLMTQAIQLPAHQFLNGIEDVIWLHPSEATLAIGTYMSEEVNYKILSPTANTKARNLEPFLRLIEEILLAGKLNPQKIL
jgi:hypothetical protein